MFNFDVRSGQEVGPFSLGMLYEDVKKMLDEPEVYEDWMGGNLNDSILVQGLVLGFDVGLFPGAKLDCFDLRYREGAMLFGKKLEEWRLDLFEGFLKDSGVDYVFEYQDEVDVDVSLIDLGLIVSFKNSRFSSRSQGTKVLL